jgi:hypothetical protein
MPLVHQHPTRLVMLPYTCFYCSAESTAETTALHLFGIRHCEAHTPDAKRDVEDYLVEHNIVRMSDAMNHDILGPFLRGLGETFPIRRSSGVLEEGWFLPWIPPLREELPIVRKSSQMGWGVNVTNGELQKFVPFQDLQHIPIVPPHLSEVLGVLERGVY